MIVSMDKKYVTRNGEYDAQVVHISDEDINYPVKVFLKHRVGEKSVLIRVTRNGFFHAYNPGQLDFKHGLDLIEVSEEKPALTLEDYHAAFVKGWDSKRAVVQPKELFLAGIKAVLELAGVKL